jgi:asparagine synthase (glutamine-hydrolysing)
MQPTTPFSGCGIAGALQFGSPSSWQQRGIDGAGMVAALAHRGPNGSGLWEDSHALLGHRRLAIMDLSESASQPLTRDTLHITYNGELYNFRELREQLEQSGVRFESSGDTEVVLRCYQRWGPACLGHFNGIFAFAIWDSARKILFLARDRLGVKPLYYATGQHALCFASEVQALLQNPCVPDDIDWETVHAWASLGPLAPAGSRTALANVQPLAAAHYLIALPDGRVTRHRYWRLPERQGQANVAAARLTTELSELLESSVDLQLTSDVPVAAFLSGGIDSSLLCALACRRTAYPLPALTLNNSSNAASDSERQDLDYSRLVAAHLQARVEHVLVDSAHAELTPASIDEVIDLATFPFDARMLSLLRNYRAVASRGLRVVLNGQGADELLGGYAGGQVPFLLSFLADPVAVARRSFLAHIDAYTKEHVKERQGHVDAVFQFARAQPGDPLEQVHRWLVHGLLCEVLRFEDYLSMRASVECRVPFLDHRIVEWAFSLPFAQHFSGDLRTGKILLRQAAAPFLPDAVVRRPKQPFPAPEMSRLRNALETIIVMHEAEISSSPIVATLFRPRAISGKLRQQLSIEQLWSLVASWRWASTLRRTRRIRQP